MERAEQLKPQTGPKCTLAFKLARNAPVAILLRRGPSSWVQMIRWNLKNDSFDTGQWFKGRIYAELSELSDDGELLLYSARKTNGWTLKTRNGIGETWTAISRPPYFTALALWSNSCWTGGGVFTAHRAVKLDLPFPAAHPELPPQRLEVTGTPEVGGPSLSLQIALREGWQMEAPLTELQHYHWQLKTRQYKEVGEGAVRIHKAISTGKHWVLHQHFSVSNVHGEVRLAQADLVDFDGRGRLIQCVGGRLLVCDTPTAVQLEWREIADFSQARPAPMPPKDWARDWPDQPNNWDTK